MAKAKLSAVILAAGEGKRLKLPEAKTLAPLAGKRLLDFPISAVKDLAQSLNVDIPITIVVGHRGDEVRSYVGENHPECFFVEQKKQQGTADALKSYLHDGVHSALESDYTLVLYGDTPLIRAQQLELLYRQLLTEDESCRDGVLASFNASIPFGFGRIVREDHRNSFSIVEEKDLEPEQKSLSEVNAGVYIFKTATIKAAIPKIKNENKTGEFYLTEIFNQNWRFQAICFPREEVFLGVNDLGQLEVAEKCLMREKSEKLRSIGVRFIDSSTNRIDWDVVVGKGTVIHPQVDLRGRTHIGEGVLLENGVIVKDSHVSNGVQIYAYSYLEGAEVKNFAHIGPFARLRPETVVGSESKIGNFVEIKKSKLEKGVKVSHLSYVGDATIGEESNIGCGFITCNYDGMKKHKTTIGERCFIGSDSQVIAPVEIGDNAYVASGSTINRDIPSGAFAIARSRQEIKEGEASRFLPSIKKK